MSRPALSNVERPILRWHGGKWLLAPWILQHIPKHRTYVEPFGGAASVLLRKPRSYAEVYNDLDEEVVGLFRVLQDEKMAARLTELLRLTPFARREFELSYRASRNPVERARRLIIRSFMGFGSNAHASQEKGHRSTGFRGNSSRSGTTPAMDWANYPEALAGIIERWRGVVIEHRDALAVTGQHDRPDTVFYFDPPYLPETRAKGIGSDIRKRMYHHELDRGGHAHLLDELKKLEGMVLLSGYASTLYDQALKGWRRFEKATLADGARPRVEFLWLNPLAADRLLAERRQPSLLEAVA